MSFTYIYHHLGLGDHIICNGLVRHLCKTNDNVVLFCKTQYLNNISYMYRDLNDLKIFDFDSDKETVYFIENKITINDKLIKIGFEDLFTGLLDHMSFDQGFYHLAGINFQIRFNEFYFKRDLEKEDEVYKVLNPNEEKYIFIIDDPSRGYTIDTTKITNKYKIIFNNYRFKMFDYIKILENAEEIHTMQTGFLDLINSYTIDKPKIYRHNYVRGYTSSLHSKGINKIFEIN